MNIKLKQGYVVAGRLVGFSAKIRDSLASNYAKLTDVY